MRNDPYTSYTARRSLALAYGLACHGLFVLGVGMMIFQMYFGMSRSFGTLIAPWSWAVNTLLILQFPLAHSLLLSKPGRKLLRYLAPPAYALGLSSTSYVIVASAQVLLLFSAWSFSGTLWWQASGAWVWALSLLYAASWLLLGKAILDAGITLQTGWLGWWSVFRNRPPAYPGMPARGLFRFCRQPIYLAFALTLWTVPTWTPDQLLLALTLTAYCLIGPLFKEARFAKVFGQAFADYKSTHPYFLPWPPPSHNTAKSNDLTIYDRYAANWWDGSVRWLRVLQNLVPARMTYFDATIDWRGKAVLDLGCGGGFMSEALAKRGAAVTGIDPAAAAIAIAGRHAVSEGLAIRYAVASGEHLPLPDQSMDHVVCVDVLEHVTDLGVVLDEIARVLRPGGYLAFDTINRNFPARLVIVILGERVVRLLPRGTHDAAMFITPRELEDLLLAKGFTACTMTGLGPTGLNRRFDITFGRLPFLTIQYMGLAKRGGG